VFSPYVDVTLTSPFDLSGVAADAGARSLTLAFVTAGTGACEPAWGGQTPIDATAVVEPAGRLRAAGVRLRVSFGGAQGSDLARGCSSASSLEAAYASVLDRYHAVAADFDLEGIMLTDHTAIVRLSRVAAELQAHTRRPLAVSLTLPVSPKGLSSAALEDVHSMLAAGVHLSTVNLLAMDYGPAIARGRMGATAIAAVDGAHRQLSALGGGLSRWSALGVTAMVGVNDVSGEIFTLADARTLVSFAAQRGLGLTSIWSLARDNPCPATKSGADPTCSGVSEPPYAFSRVFGAHAKTGLLPRRAVDNS
jgi:chitinase